MKTVNGIISTLFLALFITGCMPDSLTKFKETPVQEGSTDGGSGGSSSCVVGTGGECTPPTGFAYPDETFPYTISSKIAVPIDAFTAQQYGTIDASNDYITYSISPSLDGTGLSLNTATGEITGTPAVYIPTATYTVTLSYTGTPTISFSQMIQISAGSVITGITLFNDVGTPLLLKVDDTSSFSVSDSISNQEQAVVSTVNSIDTVENTISTTISTAGFYFSGQAIDNSLIPPSSTPQFVIERAKMTEDAVVDLSLSTAYSFSPTLSSLSGSDPNDSGNAESSEISFYISPSLLSTGLSLDSSTGVISGTTSATATAETEYTYVAYNNATGETSTLKFKLKVGTVTAGSSGSMAYHNSAADKIAITPSNTAPFINDATAFDYTDISTEEGLSATINYIDTGLMFATVNSPGEALRVGTAVDDDTSFSAPAATITNAYTIFDKSNEIKYSPTLDAALKLEDDSSDVTYQVTPDTSSFPNGLAFLTRARCIVRDKTNQTSCTASGNTWVDGICSTSTSSKGDCINSCVASAPDGDPTSCCPDTGTDQRCWTQGGTFYGNAQTDLEPTQFTVTATSASGSAATAPVTIAIGDTPKNLSTDRQVLLFVNDTTDFNVGDLIVSRDNIGRGYITGIDGTNNYLEVTIINGKFTPGTDLDTRTTFGNQVAYITAAESSVISYNAKLTLSGTNCSVLAPAPTTFTSGSGGAGTISYINGATTFVRIVSGDTTTTGGSNNFTCFNTSGGSTAESINNVDSVNLLGTFTNTTGSSTGGDFTDNSDNVAKVNEIISASQLIYTNKKGSFTSANTVIDFENIYAADSADLTAVTSTPTFYLYRGDEGTLHFTLESEAYDDTGYQLGGAIPSGMAISNGTLTGTPDSRYSKTPLTLYAANKYGFTTSSFNVKVFDTVGIKVKTDAASYILHKDGKGNNIEPCRVVEDQLDPTNPLKVNCYLDAGENDLYHKGLTIETSSGKNLCQFMTHTPYFYWNFETGSTDPTTTRYAKHVGATSCSVVGTNTNTSANATADITLADFSTVYSNVEALCTYKYDLDNPDNPNCDSGSVGEIEYTWAEVAFRCENAPATTPTGDTSVADCRANNGTCALAAGASETDCVNNGGTWTPTGIHNNTLETGYSAAVAGRALTASGALNTNSTTGNEDECIITTINTTADPTECGGSQYSCASGAIKGVGTLSEADFNLGARSVISSTNDGEVVTYAYGVPNDLAKKPSGNYYLANFFGAKATDNNSCTSGGDGYTINYTAYDDARSDGVSNLLKNAQPYYLYKCQDSSGDSKVEFRLFVREWDRNFSSGDEIDKYVPGATALPATPQNSIGLHDEYACYDFALEQIDLTLQNSTDCTLASVNNRWQTGICLGFGAAQNTLFGCLSAGGVWDNQFNGINDIDDYTNNTGYCGNFDGGIRFYNGGTSLSPNANKFPEDGL